VYVAAAPTDAHPDISASPMTRLGSSGASAKQSSSDDDVIILILIAKQIVADLKTTKTEGGSFIPFMKRSVGSS
jgi:hypothetical protein